MKKEPSGKRIFLVRLTFNGFQNCKIFHRILRGAAFFNLNGRDGSILEQNNVYLFFIAVAIKIHRRTLYAIQITFIYFGYHPGFKKAPSIAPASRVSAHYLNRAGSMQQFQKKPVLTASV